MHVSFDSKMLCVVDAASKIWFFEITEQGLLFHSQAPSISDGITSVAFHPDNTRLFVSSSAKELFEYDFNIQKLLPWAMNLTQSRILECVGSDQHILNQIAFNPKAPGELFLQTLNEFGKLSINADQIPHTQDSRLCKIHGPRQQFLNIKVIFKKFFGTG